MPRFRASWHWIPLRRVRLGTAGHSWGRNGPGLTAGVAAGYGRARLGDRLEVAAHDALVVDVLQHIALVGVVR